MAKNKHNYLIEFNQVAKKAKTYHYSYGNIRDIKLKIGGRGFSIEVFTGAEYSHEQWASDQNKVYADAVKKATLLYIMTNNRPPKVKEMTVNIDGIRQIVEHNDVSRQLYYIVEKSLASPMPKQLLDAECVGTILQQTKTSQDRRMAALVALIFSKTKKFAIERFICLWMAFNGCYGYLYGKKDRDALEKIAQEEGVEIVQDNNIKKPQQILAKVQHEINAILMQCPLDADKQYFVTNQDEVQENIKRTLENSGSAKIAKYTPYVYLFTKFAYHYRCKMVHADKPMKMFSFAAEQETHVLSILNNLLEKEVECRLARLLAMVR